MLETEIKTTPVPDIAQIETGPCPPVSLEIGTEPGEIDPQVFDDFPDIFEGVSAEAQAAQVRQESDLENGRAAERARVALGCGTCILKKECTVGKNLATRTETGPKLEMLKTAPTWLNAARLGLSGTDEKQLSAQLEDEKTKQAALETGALNLDNLLAGTTNERAAKPLKYDDLPELHGVASIDRAATFTSDRITTANGKKFDVIDASHAIGYKGPQPEYTGYKALTGKLVQRMEAVDANGDAQIFHPDGTQQKPIARVGVANVDEVRRQGSKDRLYFSRVAASPNDPDSVPRIIILGANGGDEKAQRKFIDDTIGVARKT
ncbi:MAG TPA: hypothetical protein VLG11_06155 [Candidatus Saccharimonadales bacterium]|nr:hypothetical protein [Candidatus Saccharimonadales bacterium]